jgi:hypothetical protein
MTNPITCGGANRLHAERAETQRQQPERPHLRARRRAGLVVPERSRPAGDGGQRDVLSDRNHVSARGRAIYPTLGFPQYAGEVGCSEAGDELKAQAQRDAQAALAGPLEVYNRFFLADAYREPAADVRGFVSLVKAPGT